MKPKGTFVRYNQLSFHYMSYLPVMHDK